ncbi:transmembrane protein 132E-like isoform X1 [Limulus polyphemus]|uniref:Transmembrane protein 132E-like isoform X1 n=1 Tax=Limulus polyphemus TaxID=6850 RepID=A0ABM1SP65_LIMPO|nr:transmembrane protein 132E-like isoform X1 [Limulus polyphemus]
MNGGRLLSLFGTLISVLTGSHAIVEVTLESRDSGFFLKPGHLVDHGQQGGTTSKSEKFTLVHPSSPVTVRAFYGPFSVKQTLIVPSASENRNSSQENLEDETERIPPLAVPSGGDTDVIAHIVTHEVRRDQPVLRVLFHSSRASDPKTRQNFHDSHKGALCVALYVSYQEERVMAVCNPMSSRDGVCLGEVLLPWTWWPQLQAQPWKVTKLHKAAVRVEYAVLQSHKLECTANSLLVTVPTGGSSMFLAHVVLSNSHGSYEEVKNDDVVRLLVPQAPVYPRSKVYVPVYLQSHPVYPLYVFVISLQELFTWLFEVEEDTDYHDNGRIIWQLRYVLDSAANDQYNFDDDKVQMTSRLDIQKDDVHTVLPIAKSTQLLNTAVLTGKQVSQPMRVFVISQAGKVGDVTLQSSCHAADESILKVSPSCTSVYLDGSEIRGSQNASVLVKYGTYTGQAHFLVWMPQLPLEVKLSDNKLSQVKGWRTPRLQRRKFRRPSPSSFDNHDNQASSNRRDKTQKRSKHKNKKWNGEREALDVVCRLRYQQAGIQVFTRFFSVDHNSGREAYLLSRQVSVSITELVSPFLRVADSRIAMLKGSAIQGLVSGRTEVQVLSPITGRVIGACEVQIGSDKTTITHLEVSVVTGLQLSVHPDDEMAKVFLAETAISHHLTTQYQEGLLHINIHYSDGTMTSLSDITETDYHLSVDTFDSGVVAFAPMAGLHHPRVIAIGQGKGDLLHVSLELSAHCQKRRSQPLAMAYSYVYVNFTESTMTGSVLSDSRFRGKLGSRDRQLNRVDGIRDINDVLYQDGINSLGKGKPYFYEPTVQARQHTVGGHRVNLTPLEIGLYAMLGVFCVASLVFVVSCTVFAVRYKRKQLPVAQSGESVAHAHDWVWLGRATLERNSVNTRCSQTLLPMSDSQVNRGGIFQRRDKSLTGRSVGSGCRASNLSFPGSEISIHITTNPQQAANDTEDETSLIEKGTINSLANENALHLPSLVDVEPTNKTSREKRVRIQTNLIPSPVLPGNHGKLNLQTTLSTFNTPPPVPPHQNLPIQRAIGQGLKENKNLLLVENPLAMDEINQMDWDTVARGMDYDQLMQYFDNLKESDA